MIKDKFIANSIGSSQKQGTVSIPVEASHNEYVLLGFLILHIPLGLLLYNNPLFATFDAVITILLGFWFVIIDKHPYRVIYVTAYITSAELLWRVTEAKIFWETGKYSVSILFNIIIFKI